MLREGSTRIGILSRFFVAILVVALLGFYVMPSTLASAVTQDELDAMEALVEDAEFSAGEAIGEAAKITGTGGLQDQANAANIAMENAITTAGNAVSGLEGAINGAEAAVDAINDLADAINAAGKVNDAVDAINGAIGEVNKVVDNANKVVDNAGLAIDNAQNSIDAAQEAMDKAELANEYYLKLLAGYEGNMDYTDFEKIALAENAFSEAWNDLVDAQNKALDDVDTALEKAEEAFLTATDLYDALNAAIATLKDEVEGTEFEGLLDLRIRAFAAAMDARSAAIDAAIAADGLVKLATKAEKAFNDFMDGNDISNLKDTINDFIDRINDAMDGYEDKLNIDAFKPVVKDTLQGSLKPIDKTAFDKTPGKKLNSANTVWGKETLGDYGIKITSTNGSKQWFFEADGTYVGIVKIAFKTGPLYYELILVITEEGGKFTFGELNTPEDGVNMLIFDGSGMLDRLDPAEFGGLGGLDNIAGLEGSFEFFFNNWDLWSPAIGGGDPIDPPGGGGPGGGGPGGGGPGPGGGTPVLATTPAGGIVIDPPGTTIQDTPTPQAAPNTTTITPERPPLASFAAWALLNLILTVVTGLIMIALMVTYFMKRKEDEEQEDKEEKVKKHLPLRLITIAATVVAIILFILTENMALPMVFIDQWTIWHVVITAATVVLAALSMKKYEEEEVGQEV